VAIPADNRQAGDSYGIASPAARNDAERVIFKLIVQRQRSNKAFRVEKIRPINKTGVKITSGCFGLPRETAGKEAGYC